jgi:hypothetical protein
MSIFKPKYLKNLREKLTKEYGHDIPDEAWNKVVKEAEDDIKKNLCNPLTQRAIAKAFWDPMIEMAEKGQVVVEIDGVNIGKRVRQAKITKAKILYTIKRNLNKYIRQRKILGLL